jgi:hypothetical protein
MIHIPFIKKTELTNMLTPSAEYQLFTPHQLGRMEIGDGQSSSVG